MPKYPDVTVRLTDEDGDALAIIGSVGVALRREVSSEAASQWATDAMASGSYDELLVKAMETVNVE